MLRLAKKVIRYFSPYAKPFEKKVDRFFRKLNDRTAKHRVHKKLLELMQKDLVAVNLWMEQRYKGYIYLKKKVRQRLYRNTELLINDFQAFESGQKVNLDSLKKTLQAKGLTLPVEQEKIVYLANISNYLKSKDRYTYQEGANFGKLLKDPSKEKLVGDCNQMVTLYAYLYSLRFPISDLRIKILPGHVCLHFQGIDIEATNGQFKRYDKFDYTGLIQEIIAVNLLDVSDADEKTTNITPETLLQSSRFAYLTSNMEHLVTRNLHIAYQTRGLELVKKKQFDQALVYFKKFNDKKLLDYAYRQGVTHHLNNKSFTQAKKYARASGRKDLKESILNHEASESFRQKKFKKALDIYKKINNPENIRACYLGLFNDLVKRVDTVKTLEQMKAKKAIYQKMRDYAQKARHYEGVKQVDKILSQIRKG